MNIKRLKALREQMSEEQKRKLLIGLRRFKEEYTGNIGGETDITNADNLQTNENEFTSGDTPPETKVVAKTFDTNSDFDSYVNQRGDMEMTPQKHQTIVTDPAPTPPPGAPPPAQSTPSNAAVHEPSEDDETTVD